MIRIYGGSGTRSIKAVWMAEEMGLDYEIVPVNVMTRTYPPEFKTQAGLQRTATQSQRRFMQDLGGDAGKDAIASAFGEEFGN